MRIKITAENKLGLNKKILSLLAENKIDIIKVDVETGLMYVESEQLDKHVERDLASKIMQIDGVKWVESIDLMPTKERNEFLASLLNAIADPVFGINNKGQIIYQNKTAKENFKLKKNNTIKDIFSENNWAEKIDTAASGTLPVNIETISGSMLVEVRTISQKNQKNIGAILIFHKPEDITTNLHVIDGANIKSFNTLINKNSEMHDIISRAKHMSNTQVPLIIYGESGVGKKTIAQAIHHNGTRKNKLFSSLNCSTCKPSKLQIKLFGLAHPVNSKAGLLELSDGGTIYLKSIQDMTEECQTKLLDFIQYGEFNRIDEQIKRKVDVKIIVSAPSTLKNFVDANQFNRNLFYALDISHLIVPPLRERPEDFEPLIVLLLKQFKNQGNIGNKQLSIEALSKVKSYFWPGNITQLKDMLYKSCLTNNEEIINSKQLEIEGHIQVENNLEKRNLPQAVAEFEKHFLHHWYQKYTSTRKLAQQLGVSHTTIAQKLKKYGIT